MPPKRAPRVIFSADDFGMSLPVNEAVERAHTYGVLTTTSLMVAGDAAADALVRARRLPNLHVGLHLALVHERPSAAPADIPLLVDAGGRFPVDLAAAGVRWFFLPGIRAQLEREIRAQFAAFAATGLRLDHVNAHAHMHFHPTVYGIVLRVARDYGSPPIRIPREPFGPSWRATHDNARGRLANALLLAPLFFLMRVRARRAGISNNDFVFGLNDTGAMRAPRVRALLDNLPPGVSEMYFHVATEPWPGMDPGLRSYALRDELDALMDAGVIERVRSGAVESTTYAGLARA
jgi:hopanoid biosynthesis associated protein HpnK